MDNRQDRAKIKHMKEEVKQLSDSQQKMLMQIVMTNLIRNNDTNNMTANEYIKTLHEVINAYIRKD